jgi:hypothetical protein
MLALDEQLFVASPAFLRFHPHSILTFRVHNRRFFGWIIWFNEPIGPNFQHSKQPFSTPARVFADNSAFLQIILHD